MKTKKIFTITFIFISFLLFTKKVIAQHGDIPVDPNILPIVVKVETFSELKQKSVSGTGFIVSRSVKAGTITGRARFLVTNKHMLSDWTLADAEISKFNKYIKVYFYSKDHSTTEPAKTIKIALCNDNGQLISRKVEVHKDKIVDVAIVNLYEDLKDKKNITLPTFDISYLRPFESITSLHFNIGSQVFVLGYPHGITSLRNNLPIAKFGFIASIPGEKFSLKLDVRNREEQNVSVLLTGKLLIIDGLVVSGNSGSPVILPSIVKTRINPETQELQYMAKPTKNLIIGILAGGVGSSGLSYSYSSDYIIETIDQFIKKHQWEPTDSWP